MTILNKDYLNYYKKVIIFILTYALAFILIYNTFEYIAPFFIGAILAILISPISSRLKSRYNINRGISTIILSFSGVIIFISLAVAIITTSIDSILAIINNLANNFESFNQAVQELNISINMYIDRLNNVPNINVEALVDKYTQNLLGSLRGILANAVSMISSLPYIAIFVVTLFMATYFIAKDMDKIESRVYNLFTEPTRSKVKKMKKEIIRSAIGYIKAYTILMGLTFIVTIVSFRLLNIPYYLLLSIVAALLDLIPFLGKVVIYLPLIIYYWVINVKVLAISLAVIFLVLSVVREILEPKLVSVNIGVSPLATLAAIFIGVQVKGVIGIIFFLGLIVMHKILRKVDIL